MTFVVCVLLWSGCGDAPFVADQPQHMVLLSTSWYVMVLCMILSALCALVPCPSNPAEDEVVVVNTTLIEIE